MKNPKKKSALIVWEGVNKNGNFILTGTPWIAIADKAIDIVVGKNDAARITNFIKLDE